MCLYLVFKSRLFLIDDIIQSHNLKLLAKTQANIFASLINKLIGLQFSMFRPCFRVGSVPLFLWLPQTWQLEIEPKSLENSLTDPSIPGDLLSLRAAVHFCTPVKLIF